MGVVIGLGGVKFEARRAKWPGQKGCERGRVLGEGAAAPSLPARESGECCKLPQRGPGHSPAAKRFSCILSTGDNLS